MAPGHSAAIDTRRRSPSASVSRRCRPTCSVSCERHAQPRGREGSLGQPHRSRFGGFSFGIDQEARGGRVAAGRVCVFLHCSDRATNARLVAADIVSHARIFHCALPQTAATWTSPLILPSDALYCQFIAGLQRKLVRRNFDVCFRFILSIWTSRWPMRGGCHDRRCSECLRCRSSVAQGQLG